jgi:hypothetical protein
MLSTMQNEPDRPNDVDVTEPPDQALRLSDAGYPAEAIALLGISRLHGVGFQTMTRLGGRNGIRTLLKAKDVSVFDRSISEAAENYHQRQRRACGVI